MRVAAIAWCFEIPGLQVYLFRRLSDDLLKNHMEGPSGFPALLGEFIDAGHVKINWSKNFIEFWNGAKIHLCHCQYEKDVTKYQGAEIHCLEESERIRMADGSLKRIADVVVGDFVATMQGPRVVKWVGDRELKPCVTAKVSVGGRVVTEQVQSESHTVLTPVGWVSYADIANESRLSLTSEPIQNHASRKCDEPFANEPRKSQQSHGTQGRDFVRKGGFDGQFQGHQSEPETFACKAQEAQGIDSESSSGDILVFGKPSSGFSFPVVLHALSQNREAEVSPLAFLRDGEPCAQSACMHEGCLYGCHPSGDSCDVCQPSDSGIAHDDAHTQAGAWGHTPMRSTSDDLGTAQKHSPLGQLRYAHPYTGEERTAEEAYRLGTCEVTRCGERWTIDLMVEGENHYITESGLVNKNCLLIDELTHFTDKIYRYLRGRCRVAGLAIPKKFVGLFPRILAASNPGGVGHNWVKAAFIDGAKPMQVVAQEKIEGGMRRQYIPARLADNPTMAASDPDYADRLDGLGNPALVKAMKDGDWNIVAGGMFDDLWLEARHALAPFAIPSSWRIDRSFDWGSSRPFSVGWWAESDGSEVELADGTKRTFPRGSIFRIAEWYGWNGKPNEGCRMLAAEIARDIPKLEKQIGIAGRVKPGPADSAIFDTQNGVCIADDMERSGVKWERADKSPGSRRNGWERMRKMLKASLQPHPEEAGLYVFDTCRHFIRTIPVLPRDERDPDDVDSDAEDHIADETRYRILMPKRAASVEPLRM